MMFPCEACILKKINSIVHIVTHPCMPFGHSYAGAVMNRLIIFIEKISLLFQMVRNSLTCDFVYI